MAQIQVRELIDRVAGVRLLAGTRQLARHVRSAYTTDLGDPSQYLSGGELVLTSGLWVSDAASCRVFAEALAHSRAAALGFGTGLVPYVPAELIEICTQLRLPLLEIGPEVSFQTLTELIATENTSALHAYLSGSLSRSRRLHTAAAEGGLTALLSRVEKELDASCWLLSPTGARLGGTEALVPGLSKRVLSEHLRRPESARFAVTLLGDGKISVLPGDGKFSVYMVPSSRTRWLAMLVCAKSFESMTLDQRDLVEDAVRVLSVIDSSRFAGDQVGADSAQLLMEALDGESSGMAEVETLMKVIGIPDDACLSVVIARSDEPGLADVVLDDLPSFGDAVPGVAHLGEDSARLLSTDSDHDAFHVEVLQYLDDIEPLLSGRELRIGISDPVPSAAELRQSLVQARAALNAARDQPRRASAMFACDLSSAGFLLAALGPELRMAYRRQILGRVIEYDTKHGASLEATLQGFLAHSGSFRACAEAMHLHVNTVRYRMHHVERLTGLRVTNLADQVTLYLAVHAAVTRTE